MAAVGVVPRSWEHRVHGRSLITYRKGPRLGGHAARTQRDGAASRRASGIDGEPRLRGVGRGFWLVGRHGEASEKVNATIGTDPKIIRNFCIIAHIDHGKSTLADRMLQLTGVVEARQMRAQYLDRMDIERERGITIKSQAVRLPWAPRTGNGVGTSHILNMIDTPPHGRLTHQVSRR